MSRTLWVVEHDEHGWRALEYTSNANGFPDNQTGEVIGPFDIRPDLEAALMKKGVGFNDIREGSNGNG